VNILVVCQYYYPESFSITPLCEALVRLGHRVQVVTSQPQYGFGTIPKEYRNITDEVIAGVNVHRVITFPRKKTRRSIILNYVGFYWYANQYVKKIKQKFDLVFSMSLSPISSVLPGVTYAKKHRVPHLLYCVDIWPASLVASGVISSSSLLYKVMNHWSRKIYRSVDRILIGSPSFYRYFHSHHQVHHVVKEALIQPSLKVVDVKPVVKTNSLTLLYTGNFGKLHRLDIVLEAIKQSHPSVQLYCIGHGSETQALHNLTKQYQLEKRVKIIPFLPVDQLLKYVDDADVCFVSLVAFGIIGKTIPQKLIQYLAWGKPILGMLEGDGAKIVHSSQGGLIVKPQVKALVNAIERFRKLPLLERQKMSESNRLFYEQNFKVDLASKTIDHHCTDLIKLKTSNPTTSASK